MSLHDIADDVHIDSELLVDEDVSEAPDLRPRNLRVRIGDLLGKMLHRFADDLQVALDRILCHLHDVRVTVQSSNIAPASLDGL